MRKTKVIATGACALTMLGVGLSPAPLFAQAVQAPNSSATASASFVPGWTEFVDALRDLPERMLARLTAEQRGDPQIRAEIGRLALSAVAGSTIDALASDGDHPVFVPATSIYLTTGQPNADTSYRSATLTPGGVYRLRGRRGSLALARFAEAGPHPKQTGASLNLGPPRAVHDLNALKVDAQGRYDVILSPERPKGYTGDWWQSSPTTDRLLVRLVSADWGNEAEPTLSIERLDAGPTRPRPTAGALEAKLRAIPSAVDFIAPLFVDHVEQLRQEGYVNKLKIFDVSQMGGLPGQFYYEGAYELKDDEALIVEAKVPEHCTYRSLILTNYLYETTDWYNNLSSLNDAQAQPDKDGILRIVVSARDPGVRNWLDTSGYPVGAIQGRWTECSTQPVPSIRKLALADIRKTLPAETPVVTPTERDQQIRDRRAALQQRPLW